MGSKLSSQAMLRLDALATARRHWDRVHGLVEQYAVTTRGEDGLLGPMARAATETGRIFMNNGWGVMADHAKNLAMMAKRGTGKQTKLRALREFVNSVKAAMEHAEKVIIAEDKDMPEKAE